MIKTHSHSSILRQQPLKNSTSNLNDLTTIKQLQATNMSKNISSMPPNISSSLSSSTSSYSSASATSASSQHFKSNRSMNSSSKRRRKRQQQQQPNHALSHSSYSYQTYDPSVSNRLSSYDNHDLNAADLFTSQTNNNYGENGISTKTLPSSSSSSSNKQQKSLSSSSTSSSSSSACINTSHVNSNFNNLHHQQQQQNHHRNSSNMIKSGQSSTMSRTSKANTNTSTTSNKLNTLIRQSTSNLFTRALNYASSRRQTTNASTQQIQSSTNTLNKTTSWRVKLGKYLLNSSNTANVNTPNGKKSKKKKQIKNFDDYDDDEDDEDYDGDFSTAYNNKYQHEGCEIVLDNNLGFDEQEDLYSSGTYHLSRRKPIPIEPTSSTTALFNANQQQAQNQTYINLNTILSNSNNSVSKPVSLQHQQQLIPANQQASTSSSTSALYSTSPAVSSSAASYISNSSKMTNKKNASNKELIEIIPQQTNVNLISKHSSFSKKTKPTTSTLATLRPALETTVSFSGQLNQSGVQKNHSFASVSNVAQENQVVKSKDKQLATTKTTGNIINNGFTSLRRILKMPSNYYTKTNRSQNLTNHQQPLKASQTSMAQKNTNKSSPNSEQITNVVRVSKKSNKLAENKNSTIAKKLNKNKRNSSSSSTSSSSSNKSFVFYNNKLKTFSNSEPFIMDQTSKLSNKTETTNLNDNKTTQNKVINMLKLYKNVLNKMQNSKKQDQLNNQDVKESSTCNPLGKQQLSCISSSINNQSPKEKQNVELKNEIVQFKKQVSTSPTTKIISCKPVKINDHQPKHHSFSNYRPTTKNKNVNLKSHHFSSFNNTLNSANVYSHEQQVDDLMCDLEVASFFDTKKLVKFNSIQQCNFMNDNEANPAIYFHQQKKNIDLYGDNGQVDEEFDQDDYVVDAYGYDDDDVNVDIDDDYSKNLEYLVRQLAAEASLSSFDLLNPNKIKQQVQLKQKSMSSSCQLDVEKLVDNLNNKLKYTNVNKSIAANSNGDYETSINSSSLESSVESLLEKSSIDFSQTNSELFDNNNDEDFNTITVKNEENTTVHPLLKSEYLIGGLNQQNDMKCSNYDQLNKTNSLIMSSYVNGNSSQPKRYVHLQSTSNATHKPKRSSSSFSNSNFNQSFYNKDLSNQNASNNYSYLNRQHQHQQQSFPISSSNKPFKYLTNSHQQQSNANKILSNSNIDNNNLLLNKNYNSTNQLLLIKPQPILPVTPTKQAKNSNKTVTSCLFIENPSSSSNSNLSNSIKIEKKIKLNYRKPMTSQINLNANGSVKSNILNFGTLC